jgi:hypothetical protein
MPSLGINEMHIIVEYRQIHSMCTKMLYVEFI